MGCKAWTREHERIIYYVSQAGADQEVFVFTDLGMPGRILLYNGLVNVSVVDIVQRRMIFDDVEE